jgi:hypothetical protein
LNWNKWVRQTHRWLSIAFTVAVIINIVAVVQVKYTSRVGLLAVFPLALLLLTGLYLFVLPYATMAAGVRSAAATGVQISELLSKTEEADPWGGCRLR